MNSYNSVRVNLQTDLIDGHVHLSEMEHPGRAVENAINAGVIMRKFIYESLQIVQNSGVIASLIDQGLY